jgi:23S rRNA (adenine2503-C2)-methyltransferase
VSSPYDLSRDDLAALLAGEPRFRVDQIWHGLYRARRSPAEMTELPSRLRRRLKATPELNPALEVVAHRVADDGTTVKAAFSVAARPASSRSVVESVLMHYPDRSSVCVSSQAGCAMACSFCATGRLGFAGQLSAGAILEQFVWADREARRYGRPGVSNVVFMGMGEPLANYGAVSRALDRLTSEFQFSPRRVTVSTVGVVPVIGRLARDHPQVNLAVSLHAADDAQRAELIPLARRYHLEDLVLATARHRQATGRRPSFEWVMLAGVNDSDDDASRLARLARLAGAHVNLIPFNVSGACYQGSSPAAIERFRRRLLAGGVAVTIRVTRGTDIDAACGQLAGRSTTLLPLRPDRMDPWVTSASSTPVSLRLSSAR